jgi:ADP-ribose pyrophosphatase YjhB (NUDIX family)
MSSEILNPRPSFCIWCGSQAEGDIVIRCPACNRTHFLNSKISASALIVDGDRYLTVRRAAPPELGKWDLPGGFTNYGEPPADAAGRETLEESGIKVVVDRLLDVFMDRYLEPDGTYWPTINLIYLAHPFDPNGDLTHVDANEISDIAWHPLTTPPTNIAFPTQQLGAIDAYLRPPT